jgi:hypothetical protein
MSLRKSKPSPTRNESFSLSYLANVSYFLIAINFEPAAEGLAAARPCGGGRIAMQLGEQLKSGRRRPARFLPTYFSIR